MSQSSTLRILSYNIHHGAGLDGKLDLERTAEVMMRVAPDLVAIQEVDRCTHRTGHVDQAVELARLTGMHAAFCPSIDYDGGEYGNAVLSRWPMLSTDNVALPGKEPRSALIATVEPVPGLRVNIISTHFTLIRDSQWASVPLVNHLAATVADGEPVILAGDLNSIPQSEALRMLRETWEIAGDGQILKSYPADAPKVQIDYIMVKPCDRLSLRAVEVIPEGVASDHYPISALFSLS